MPEIVRRDALNLGALGRADKPPAVGVAAVPPTALLLSVHGLAVLAKATASGGVYRAAVTATGALAVCAFVLSFVALRDLAMIAGIRPWLAPVLPLVIDLAIGVATLALAAIGEKPAVRRRNASRGAAADATTAAMSPGVEAIERDCSATGDRTSATLSDAQTATLGANRATQDLAARLVAARRATRQSLETVVAILMTHERGDPMNRIAKRLDVHHSAVSRVIGAAASRQEQFAKAE